MQKSRKMVEDVLSKFSCTHLLIRGLVVRHEPLIIDGLQSLEEALEIDSRPLSHNEAFVVDDSSIGLNALASFLIQAQVLYVNVEYVRTKPLYGCWPVVLAAQEQVGRLDGEAKVGPVDARCHLQALLDSFKRAVGVGQMH